MSNLPTKRYNPRLIPRSLFSPSLEEFFGDDWMSELFRPMWNERMGACDFEKTADAYIVSVDVPGLTKEEVKVNVEDGVMSISGERKPKAKKDDSEYLASERTYRRFERTFRLPDDINYDKVDAKVEDGVLTVRFARTKTEKSAKTIEIK